MYIALNLNSELEKKKRKIYRNDNRLETCKTRTKIRSFRWWPLYSGDRSNSVSSKILSRKGFHGNEFHVIEREREDSRPRKNIWKRGKRKASWRKRDGRKQRVELDGNTDRRIAEISLGNFNDMQEYRSSSRRCWSISDFRRETRRKW